MLDKIKDTTKEKIRNFLIKDYYFEEVLVLKEVVEAMIDLANEAYPNEYTTFLKGRIKDKTLTFYEMVYQPYHASRTSTRIRIDLPLTSGVLGSVHSHPGFSNRPSMADTRFFSKQGMVHFIICRPYAVQSIACYDKNGRRIDWDLKIDNSTD
ncbi:Mov34/MPN/PAD-1 family protein [Candidatus Woesearchaeota archaeon]|nr:Mov34/MPN/PAD-1 family protein [Candidatus Woesearchaeota archaeon]